jgi:hypothetical protein
VQPRKHSAVIHVVSIDNGIPIYKWRDKERVRSRYIKQEDIVHLSEQIEQRRKDEKEIKALRIPKKEFDRIIGKEF